MAAAAIFISTLPAITIGTPATDPTCFPFGCEGTRYQQVYAADSFSNPFTIGAINFFTVDPGTLPTGTFSFSLSTSANPVDALDTAVLDNNLGADNQLFGAFQLDGSLAGPTLSFIGTPFLYDPSMGDLLLDMQISISQFGGATFLGHNATAGGLFSRAHDFGGGFAGYGLVTEFLPPTGDNEGPTPVPEPGTLMLVGGGLLFALRNKSLRSRFAGLRSSANPN